MKDERNDFLDNWTKYWLDEYNSERPVVAMRVGDLIVGGTSYMRLIQRKSPIKTIKFK